MYIIKLKNGQWILSIYILGITSGKEIVIYANPFKVVGIEYIRNISTITPVN